MELDFLKWIDHAGFLLEAKGKKIAIDPFRIRDPAQAGKADIIFITHSHFDHLSNKDIDSLRTDGTKIVAPKESADKLSGDVLAVEPGKSYSVAGISFSTVPAYNTKPERLNFHPRANNWVGYIIDTGKAKVYHAGDTDFVEEMRQVDVDLALLPAGGTYTMDVDEAANAAKAIKATYVAPMHYKALAGKDYAKIEKRFKELVSNAVILQQIQEPYYSLR